MMDNNEPTQKMGEMETLGRKCRTDKITHHGYHRFYPLFIDFLKDTEGAGMLEIGLEEGCSLSMWSEYFPNVHIYGVDIGASTKIHRQDDRHTIFQCDQSDESEVRWLVDHIDRPILFINDDASHVPEHQVLTFNHLFRDVLREDGVYIIEDIETSYWTRNAIYNYPTRYGFLHKNSIIERCKILFDYINREFLNEESRIAVENACTDAGFDLETLKLVQSMTICQNCIIFKKIGQGDQHYMDRSYRFRDNL